MLPGGQDVTSTVSGFGAKTRACRQAGFCCIQVNAKSLTDLAGGEGKGQIFSLTLLVPFFIRHQAQVPASLPLSASCLPCVHAMTVLGQGLLRFLSSLS